MFYSFVEPDPTHFFRPTYEIRRSKNSSLFILEKHIVDIAFIYSLTLVYINLIGSIRYLVLN